MCILSGVVYLNLRFNVATRGDGYCYIPYSVKLSYRDLINYLVLITNLLTADVQ